MKGKKYNKTAQDSSSTMRSNTDTLRSITKRLGNIMCTGNVECTPEDDATHVERQILCYHSMHQRKYDKIAHKISSAAMGSTRERERKLHGVQISPRV